MACGFILAGGVYSQPGTLADAEAICVLMGEYFQVQVSSAHGHKPLRHK